MKFWIKGKAADLASSLPAQAPKDEPTGPKPAEAERWVGFIDKIDRARILGWGYDRSRPIASVAVEAVGSGGSHAVAVASLFRQDVKDSGHGSGHHGFELDIADFDDRESVTVRFVGSERAISTAPIALDPVNALRTNALSDSFERAAQQLARNVEMRHSALKKGSMTGKAAAPYDEKLLATFDPARDPEGLITRFTAQEAARVARNAFEFDMVGSLQDRLGVLLWYVDDYAASHPMSARIPLGSGQLAALNAPALIAGASAAVTVALHNFAMRHRPDLLDLRDAMVLREAVYWWCAEQAPLLRLEDRLVTPAQIEILSAVERGAGTEFPCTVFMTLHAQRHEALHGLDLGVPRDRAALVAFLMLESFRQPSLLRFLSREALRRLLRDDGAGVVVLDEILGRLATIGAHQDMREAGRAIRRKGEELLAAAGHALSTRRPVLTMVPPPQVPRQGVAVLGPLSKSSGLGRAMRLSLEALATCETIAPTSHDFGMANPAPGEASPASYGELDAPREITLIHLNAEALPLALAFGPRQYLAGSYRIGFFFWELNEIPECHRLALDLVDEIWVASEYDREVYARHTNKPVIRVGMAASDLPEGGPVRRNDWGLDPNAFVFIAAFDSLSFIARKNPLAVIEAFAAAFPLGDEPVQLVLKTQNRSVVTDPWQMRNWRAIDQAIAADPRILLVDETLPFPDLIALMRACDSYVSLHRAEGWGFGLVEAMQLGLPVICTGYSGNADFCTPQTAFVVDHDLIPVAVDEYIYVPRGSVWANPRLGSAVAQMRLIATDRTVVAARTEAAKAFVARELSLERVAGRYAERLAAIRGQFDGKAVV